MSCTHVTVLERIELGKLRETTELSLRAIAKRMTRSQSSLTREIQRNRLNSEVKVLQGKLKIHIGSQV
jgi:IS30 family transposase